MARPLRVEFPGAVYHITVRGNERQAIFREDEDRKALLRTLESVVSLRRWIVHAYCLMGNHFHLLVETPAADLSRGMRSLNGEYTQAFNRRHRRCGHLFQGRFGSVVVEKQSHLLALCRYIVLNPVRVRARGMKVARPEAWPWSSYRATAGLEKPPAFLEVRWVLGQFGGSGSQARQRYAEFVAQGDKREQQVTARMVMGSETFAESVAKVAAEKLHHREHPRKERRVGNPPLAMLLPKAAASDLAKRNAAMRVAHREHGYTQAEIAEHLGLHPATVCRILKALAGERP